MMMPTQSSQIMGNKAALPSFLNQLMGPPKSNPRLFSTSVITRAAEDPTTSKTGSSFKAYWNNFGRQIAANYPIFLVYAAVLIVAGDEDAEPSEKKSTAPQKPAN